MSKPKTYVIDDSDFYHPDDNVTFTVMSYDEKLITIEINKTGAYATQLVSVEALKAALTSLGVI